MFDLDNIFEYIFICINKQARPWLLIGIQIYSKRLSSLYIFTQFVVNSDFAYFAMNWNKTRGGIVNILVQETQKEDQRKAHDLRLSFVVNQQDDNNAPTNVCLSFLIVYSAGISKKHVSVEYKT